MNKPKIYELWFSDYDGSGSWQFTHPNNKLKMEFEQDCQDVLREFAPNEINEKTSWVGTLDLLELIADNLKSRGYIPFDETFENISFGMGGSCIIRKEYEYQEENEPIVNLLGADLTQAVYAHNEKIETKILKRLK